MADISKDAGLPPEAVRIASKGVRGSDWFAGPKRVRKVKNWMARSWATA
jgi:hypothetical protein